jgi:cytidyltransferase-like protein
MNATNKIVSFSDLPEVISGFRKKGCKIVQCHGTFDLIHPGHLYHFEEAKADGDVLVVTITAAQFVRKGPGRPFFADPLRAKSLAALSCVDVVSIVPYSAAREAILAVRPDVYCKGIEYKNKLGDATGKLPEDIATVRKIGGRMAYVGSVVCSSSKLLHDHFEIHSENLSKFCRKISRHTTPMALRASVEEFSKLKLLVVGDIIFDRYSMVNIQGLTSKNKVISGRFLREETQAGGSLAVYRHLRAFAPQTRLIGVVGREPWVEPIMNSSLSKQGDLVVRNSDYVSVLKQRFVEPQLEGKEISKIFSVNYLNEDNQIHRAIEGQIMSKLMREVPKADAVLVTDFGHGLLSERIRDYLQKKARILVVNCQTNSNNFAFNLINRRYDRVDAFSLDSTELHLAAAQKKISYSNELEKLARQLGARYAWLTRGSVETLGWDRKSGFVHCEPLAKAVVDTVGAGDAFFSLAALGVASKLPLDLITLLAQLGGAEAVGIVGNREPISKANILKGALSLLS